MEYLEGVPSWAATSRSEEKKVRINIQKAFEYLEGSNDVCPKSSPLLGMIAQPLHAASFRRGGDACQLLTL